MKQLDSLVVPKSPRAPKSPKMAPKSPKSPALASKGKANKRRLSVSFSRHVEVKMFEKENKQPAKKRHSMHSTTPALFDDDDDNSTFLKPTITNLAPTTNIEEPKPEIKPVAPAPATAVKPSLSLPSLPTSGLPAPTSSATLLSSLFDFSSPITQDENTYLNNTLKTNDFLTLDNSLSLPITRNETTDTIFMKTNNFHVNEDTAHALPQFTGLPTEEEDEDMVLDNTTHVFNNDRTDTVFFKTSKFTVQDGNTTTSIPPISALQFEKSLEDLTENTDATITKENLSGILDVTMENTNLTSRFTKNQDDKTDTIFFKTRFNLAAEEDDDVTMNTGVVPSLPQEPEEEEKDDVTMDTGLTTQFNSTHLSDDKTDTVFFKATKIAPLKEDLDESEVNLSIVLEKKEPEIIQPAPQPEKDDTGKSLFEDSSIIMTDDISLNNIVNNLNNEDRTDTIFFKAPKLSMNTDDSRSLADIALVQSTEASDDKTDTVFLKAKFNLHQDDSDIQESDGLTENMVMSEATCTITNNSIVMDNAEKSGDIITLLRSPGPASLLSTPKRSLPSIPSINAIIPVDISLADEALTAPSTTFEISKSTNSPPTVEAFLQAIEVRFLDDVAMKRRRSSIGGVKKTTRNLSELSEANADAKARKWREDIILRPELEALENGCKEISDITTEIRSKTAHQISELTATNPSIFSSVANGNTSALGSNYSCWPAAMKSLKRLCRTEAKNEWQTIQLEKVYQPLHCARKAALAAISQDKQTIEESLAAMAQTKREIEERQRQEKASALANLPEPTTENDQELLKIYKQRSWEVRELENKVKQAQHNLEMVQALHEWKPVLKFNPQTNATELKLAFHHCFEAVVAIGDSIPGSSAKTVPYFNFTNSFYHMKPDFKQFVRSLVSSAKIEELLGEMKNTSTLPQTITEISFRLGRIHDLVNEFETIWRLYSKQVKCSFSSDAASFTFESEIKKISVTFSDISFQYPYCEMKFHVDEAKGKAVEEVAHVIARSMKQKSFGFLLKLSALMLTQIK